VETYNLVGTPDEIGEKLQEFIAAGCTYFPALIMATRTFEETFDQMQQFAEDVMGHFLQ
jgi:hypothetical protein